MSKSGVEFKGFDQFILRVQGIGKRMQPAAPQTVAVGVLAKSGADLVIIAAANEYGAIAGNGAVIPSRPFLRLALRSKDVAAFVRATMTTYYKGGLDLFGALTRIGLFTQGAVRKSIGSNIPPPNAPSTIAKKGSSATLIDTGRLRQSISYEIVDKRGRS